MPFRNVLSAEHQAILNRVLDDVCAATGIDPQSPEGEEVANLILHLYGCGYQSADGLKSMLDAQRDDDDRKRSG